MDGKRSRWRPFEEARAFVSSLGLGSQKGWHEYSRSGRRPPDIPSNPQRTYEAAWQGWGDWLGTGYVPPRDRRYRSFEEAREFARSLGLASYAEWTEWRGSGDRPEDIPSNPNLVYEGDGWAGWGDWLGTGRVAHANKVFRPFEEARAFARSLGLGSETRWREYSRSGKKPDDMPANPPAIYGDRWQGWGDFLGTGTVANREKVFRPYEEAREFVRGLGLGDAREWREYVRSGRKPDDIPANPDQVYGHKWKAR